MKISPYLSFHTVRLEEYCLLVATSENTQEDVQSQSDVTSQSEQDYQTLLCLSSVTGSGAVVLYEDFACVDIPLCYFSKKSSVA